MTPTRLEWFGSSGIRGPIERVDAELGQRLGRAIGATERHVIVGRDARHTGITLQEALVSGVLTAGGDVTDVGMLPTPALAHATRRSDATLGVMVTASHNPAPDNGYKLWGPTGSALPEDALLAIEARMRSTEVQRAAWDHTGRRSEHTGALGDYVTAVLAHLHDNGYEVGALTGERIALDCAHGVGALATPHLLARLGARLTLLGGAPHGSFPDHPSEPSADNLTGLRDTLQQGGHVLGIAHDGDADRTVFLDAKGRIIASERILVVLARRRGDTRIAVPVDAGGLLRRALPDAHLEVTPVGDVHVSRAIEAGHASLGAEPSGTWFLADWSPAPEGPYAACLVAAMLAHDPDLIEEAMGLPAPARLDSKHPVAAETDRYALALHTAALLETRLEHERIIAIDGARIETADGWLLVRASGTEHLIRITAEADSEAAAAALQESAQQALKEAAEGVTPAPERREA